MLHESENINSENRFSHFLMSQCLGMRRWSLAISLLLYIAFSVMDFVKFPPEIYSSTLPTRFFLVIMPLLYLNYVYLFSPPKSIRKYTVLMLVVYLGCGLNHTLIYYLSELYGFQFSQLGLVLIIMFGCLLFVLPIKHASIVTTIILSIYLGVNIYIDHPLADLIFSVTILSFLAGICLAINHVSQKVIYQNYLLIKRLYNESITDGLTKLNNKRAFEEQIERLNAIATRDHASIALVFIDADNFKYINDSCGHHFGDKVLKKIAKVIEQQCRRSGDIGFRVGGDEFALILYGVSETKLKIICANVVNEIANFNLIVKQKKIVTSVSLGAALKSKKVNVSSDELVKVADDFLYKAKENGRNQYYLEVLR